MVHRKTRPGRLSALDRLLLARERSMLVRTDGPFAHAAVVDVGLGVQPWTTVELHESLELLEPAPPVVGVDIDPGLVDEAQAFARPGLRFVLGDLGAPGAVARVVRVLNVLRDRREADVPAAHAALVEPLVPGGVMLEGTCSRHGEVGVVHCVRRTETGAVREALWMWTDGSQGSAPLLFRDRLPRDLRGHARRTDPVGVLLHDWMDAYRACDGQGLPRLETSVARLGRADLVAAGPGAVVWMPVSGVPVP